MLHRAIFAASEINYIVITRDRMQVIVNLSHDYLSLCGWESGTRLWVLFVKEYNGKQTVIPWFPQDQYTVE